MLVTPTLEMSARGPTPAIACARIVDGSRSESYARGRSGNQFKSTHSLQVHRADNQSMHRSRCVSVPVVAFGILPPPLRHPCPVMLGVIRLNEMNNPYRSSHESRLLEVESQELAVSRFAKWLRGCLAFGIGYAMPFVIMICCNIIKDGPQQIREVPGVLPTIIRMHWPPNANGWVMLLPSLFCGVVSLLAFVTSVSRKACLFLLLTASISHVLAFVLFPDSLIDALPPFLGCALWSLAVMILPSAAAIMMAIWARSSASE